MRKEYQSIINEYKNQINGCPKGLTCIDKFDVDDRNGVWALFAKEKNTNNKQWICLQVGKSKGSLTEIKGDLFRIFAAEEAKLVDVRFINQFGEEIPGDFVKKYPKDVDQIYKFISEQYKDFVFMEVASNVSDEDRTEIERCFAWIVKARFWRNGGSFSCPREMMDQSEELLEQMSNIDVKRIIKKFIEENKGEIYRL